jgi:hypothetical protein
MAKYELLEETQPNGQVWYKIMQDNTHYVYGSLTRHLDEAKNMLEAIENGHKSGFITKVIKTIELDENQTD